MHSIGEAKEVFLPNFIRFSNITPWGIPKAATGRGEDSSIIVASAR
jgi:hypothetical protein